MRSQVDRDEVTIRIGRVVFSVAIGVIVTYVVLLALDWLF